MDNKNRSVEPAMENVMDYSIPIFTGTHNKKTSKIKKPFTLKYADDESGLQRKEDDFLEEEKSSTERVRRYYKRHPKKVKQYLRKTQDDRVARNRDRKKAIEKYGEDKMKNHDVHHPNGPGNGWRLAKKDHGRDRKDGTPPETGLKKKKPSTPSKKPSAPSKKPKAPTAKKRKVPVKMAKMLFQIKRFVLHAVDKLNLQQIPNITIIQPTKDMTSLGYFDPMTQKIHVVIKNRLLADVLRTIAHELVHLKQKEMNLPMDGSTGSDTENQANAVAGVLLRMYGKENNHIFMMEQILQEETVKELKKYKFVRKFTEEELQNEVGEYFENEATFKAFPDLAKSPKELSDMIENAPEEVLTKEQLKTLLNSSVPDVLNSESPKDVIKQIAKDNTNAKEPLVKILKGIKNNDEFPVPIVIQYPDGYYLMGGDKRLSVLAATGHTMPVKILKYTSTPNLPSTGSPKKDAPQQDDEKKAKTDKELFNRVLQMKITNPETGNLIKVDTAMDYNKMHPAHQIALNTIRQYMKGVSTRAGVPKNKTA
jgi:hypothetical protein